MVEMTESGIQIGGQTPEKGDRLYRVYDHYRDSMDIIAVSHDRLDFYLINGDWEGVLHADGSVYVNVTRQTIPSDPDSWELEKRTVAHRVQEDEDEDETPF